MRVFVALEMDPEPRSRLAERLAELRGRLRNERVTWVRPENLHVTLRFLGELPDNRVAEVREVLSGVRRAPCPFEPCRWGAFPNEQRPRVLWVGSADAQEQQMAGLAEMVESCLHSIGIPREPKPFRAHVTVGRARGPLARVSDAFASVPLRGIGLSTGARFVLMESILGPSGPRYTPVAHYDLGIEKG